jgi:hypothetical protein
MSQEIRPSVIRQDRVEFRQLGAYCANLEQEIKDRKLAGVSSPKLEKELSVLRRQGGFLDNHIKTGVQSLVEIRKTRATTSVDTIDATVDNAAASVTADDSNVVSLPARRARRTRRGQVMTSKIGDLSGTDLQPADPAILRHKQVDFRPGQEAPEGAAAFAAAATPADQIAELRQEMQNMRDSFEAQIRVLSESNTALQQSNAELTALVEGLRKDLAEANRQLTARGGTAVAPSVVAATPGGSRWSPRTTINNVRSGVSGRGCLTLAAVGGIVALTAGWCLWPKGTQVDAIAASVTPTRTGVATQTVTPTATGTGEAVRGAAGTATARSAATETPTPTASPTGSRTPEASATATATGSRTPEASATATVTGTRTPDASATTTTTVTGTRTPEASATVVAAATPLATPIDISAERIIPHLGDVRRFMSQNREVHDVSDFIKELQSNAFMQESIRHFLPNADFQKLEFDNRDGISTIGQLPEYFEARKLLTPEEAKQFDAALKNNIWGMHGRDVGVNDPKKAIHTTEVSFSDKETEFMKLDGEVRNINFNDKVTIKMIDGKPFVFLEECKNVLFEVPQHAIVTPTGVPVIVSTPQGHHVVTAPPKSFPVPQGCAPGWTRSGTVQMPGACQPPYTPPTATPGTEQPTATPTASPTAEATLIPHTNVDITPTPAAPTATPGTEQPTATPTEEKHESPTATPAAPTATPAAPTATPVVPTATPVTVTTPTAGPPQAALSPTPVIPTATASVPGATATIAPPPVVRQSPTPASSQAGEGHTPPPDATPGPSGIPGHPAIVAEPTPASSEAKKGDPAIPLATPGSSDVPAPAQVPGRHDTDPAPAKPGSSAAPTAAAPAAASPAAKPAPAAPTAAAPAAAAPAAKPAEAQPAAADPTKDKPAPLPATNGVTAPPAPAKVPGVVHVDNPGATNNPNTVTNTNTTNPNAAPKPRSGVVPPAAPPTSAKQEADKPKKAEGSLWDYLGSLVFSQPNETVNSDESQF